MTNLEAALEYLKRGWSVVPAHGVDDEGVCTCARIDCPSPGKHPRVSWAQYQQEFPGDGQVRTWWRRWPDANIAICTGKVSGLVVVDVDPRHGGDESLKELALPATVTALTGGGGEHLYYRHPGGTVHNGANLLPGIDLRGDGGYVIAPPSTHISGTAYAWEAGYGPGECELAPYPKIAQGGALPAVAANHGDAIVLSDYTEGVVRVGEGERNVHMTRLTGHLLAHMNPEQAWGNLKLSNLLCCTPPLTDDELRTILRSIYSRQERKTKAVEALATRSFDSALLPNDERVELARAAWGELGVAEVVDWVKLVSADGIDYQLELADRVISLGGALLGGKEKIRDVVLNATGGVIPHMKADAWEPLAGTLARLAREVYTGAMRQSDEVQEWLDEYSKVAVACDQELRGDHLRTGPILYNGRLAVKTRRILSWLEANFATKLDAQALGKKLTISGWKYQAVRTGAKPNEVVKCWVSPELPE